MFVIVSKIFALILAVTVFAKSYLDFRSRTESLRVFLFWTITWASIVVIALFPSIIDAIISFAGGGRAGLGTFFGMAIVFLFFTVYRVYVKIGRIEHRKPGPMLRDLTVAYLRTHGFALDSPPL